MPRWCRWPYCAALAYPSTPSTNATPDLCRHGLARRGTREGVPSWMAIGMAPLGWGGVAVCLRGRTSKHQDAAHTQSFGVERCCRRVQEGGRRGLTRDDVLTRVNPREVQREGTPARESSENRERPQRASTPCVVMPAQKRQRVTEDAAGGSRRPHSVCQWHREPVRYASALRALAEGTQTTP
jgi:hypothetical protein